MNTEHSTREEVQELFNRLRNIDKNQFLLDNAEHLTDNDISMLYEDREISDKGNWL